MPAEPFALTPQEPEPMAGDYDAIHAAVMETARGRWFLKEFARHNRNADTMLLLAAIEKIEASLRIQTAIPALSHSVEPSHSAGQSHTLEQRPEQTVLAADSAHQLHELRDAISLTRESLPGADGLDTSVSADFGPVAAGIAQVAARIRIAAEHVLESAWSLRERAERDSGPDKAALESRCSELETQARELAQSCGQLDALTANASLVAALLTEIETRLDGMIGERQADTQRETIAAKTFPDAAKNPAPTLAAREPSLPPPTASAPLNANWMDTLAPPVHGGDRSSASSAAAVNFDFDGEPRPAMLPNPATREEPDHSRPAPKPAPANNNAGLAAKAAPRPSPLIKPADPLAPIRALSDEERIALFS